jgi:hypothetical protein
VAPNSAFQQEPEGRNALDFSMRKRIFETFRQSFPKEDRRYRHTLCKLRSAQNISRMP